MYWYCKILLLRQSWESEWNDKHKLSIRVIQFKQIKKGVNVLCIYNTILY